MPSATQLVTLLTASRARKREQWLSPDDLQRLRATRLQRLASPAARTGYYGRLFREAGVDPTRLADEQQLRRLPVLEKAALHAAEESAPGGAGEQHPHTLSSYAMSLEAIADTVLERGITDIRPKVAFSAAMALSDRGRMIAKDAFGVTPQDVYVSVELGPRSGPR